MTNMIEQREIFWKIFNDVLKEKGEPFKISFEHKITHEITPYAAVNRNSSFNANAIDLSFLLRERMFRVDLYVTSPILMRKFMDNKIDIDNMVSLPLIWDNGKRVLRPSIYFDFIPNDMEDYRNVIEESLPIIIEFIEIANKYGKDEFFDF